MAEKRDYVAKIRAKGLDQTGVTEDVARGMYAALGQTTVAVVELHHADRTEDAEGQHTVHLNILHLEPAKTAGTEAALRDVLRGLHLSRGADGADGQTTLTLVGDERSLDDVAEAASAQVERDADGNPVGVWDGDPDAAVDGPRCDFPGCFAAADHDGDHEDSEGDPLNAEG